MSERFFRLAFLAYSNSHISKHRLAEILKVNLSDLAETMAQQGYA